MMANSHHLKIVKLKLQYLSNGLTDRREIWHDDDIGVMILTLHPCTMHTIFCIIKLQKLKTCHQFLFLVKAAALKQQILKIYPQILEASFCIYYRPLTEIYVMASVH